MRSLTKVAEIRDLSQPDHGVELGLFVEGDCRVTASAGAEELEAMERFLKKSREQVTQDLEQALEDWFNDELEKVEVSRLEQQEALKFYGEYTYRAFDEILAGVVWYDVQTGETGPEKAPVIARNRLRAQVHQHLSSQLSQR